MTKRTFSTFDINRILGLKIERQKDWLTRGYIHPSIQKATGQGTKNVFSIEDVYLIALFQYLMNKGFSRKVAAASIASIRWLHTTATEVHRIRGTRLNAAGLTKIRKRWARLDDIDFIVLGYADAQEKSGHYENLPPIEALRFADSEKSDRIEILRDQYSNVDDIFLINFKKFRDKVDAAIENG